MNIFTPEKFDEQKVKGTVRIFLGTLILFFILFFMRLVYLQVIIGQELESLSENNRLRNVVLDSYRGKILDRHGIVIGDIKPAFKLMVIAEDTKDLSKELRQLSEMMHLNEEKLRETIRKHPRYLPVMLQRNLKREEVARFEEHKLDFPGFYISFETIRHYPFGHMLAHTIGYIGEINQKEITSKKYPGRRKGDSIGKSGIEKVYEQDLFGTKGEKTVEVDSAGREISMIRLTPPQFGKVLTLTIDMDLQKTAEEALGKESGSVVALNPQNGDILAFVSHPDFDPNNFSSGISSKTWRRLSSSKEHPLTNRSIQGVYPPGSIYKIIVAAAGLEEGTLEPEKKIFCNGRFKLGRRTYRCWKKVGHGKVDFIHGFMRSCDVYYYKQGMHLGIDTIARYANMFGLGKRTGINLPHEERGLIPTKAWKERVKKEKWIQGETISASIGQGFDLVTPLQVAVATAVIANGGYRVTPRIAMKEEIKREKLPLQESTIQWIREAMRNTVMTPGGTAYRARIKGITMGGKTGTAQVVALGDDKERDRKLNEIPYHLRDHAWFTSFAPVEDSRIVVSVIVEHGGHGGSKAAPIARKIIKAHLTKLNLLQGKKE